MKELEEEVAHQVFPEGGPREQFWRGQGCPLFDDVGPAFLLPTTALPALQRTPKGGYREVVVASNKLTLSRGRNSPRMAIGPRWGNERASFRCSTESTACHRFARLTGRGILHYSFRYRLSQYGTYKATEDQQSHYSFQSLYNRARANLHLKSNNKNKQQQQQPQAGNE